MSQDAVGNSCEVAPFAGAWIEMNTNVSMMGATLLLPSRERGLKLVDGHIDVYGCVAPFAGAWIEIS